MSRRVSIIIGDDLPDELKRFANEVEQELQRIFSSPINAPVKSSANMPKANNADIVYVSETDQLAYADLTTNTWKYIKDGTAV